MAGYGDNNPSRLTRQEDNNPGRLAGGGDNKASYRRKKVLCVGNSCVDFVNVAKEYPVEDSDQRGLEYYWQRGGNASNNCTVLSLLSIPCEFLGVLGSHGVEASWIKGDFGKCGIDTSHCVIKPVQCPVSTIVLSQATGSRTILFYARDRPELTHSEFKEIFHEDFSAYSWLHFELNHAVEDISLMIDDVITYNNKKCDPESLGSKVIVSIEIEKPEIKNPESLMCKADVVFISKDFAKMKGYLCPSLAVDGLYKLCKDGALLICAWGDVGASARCRDIILTVPAVTDIKVIDTLGAGDTFVAGVITSLWKQGWTAASRSHNDDNTERSIAIKTAVEFGCKLAGLKCTMYGYQGLRNYILDVSTQI